MPKMKTSKTTAKRYKLTGTGKLSRMKQHNQHKFEVKSSNRKRRLDGYVGDWRNVELIRVGRV